MSKRPFISATDRNPWGESFDEGVLDDGGRDVTFIEGYSDIRTKRELDLRAGRKVAPLRHRLQWVRSKNISGTEADGRQLDRWQSLKRYKTISYEDAVKQGYRVDRNPAIRKGEDGLCYLGEQVLMIADAKVAAANFRRVQQDQQAMEEAPAQRVAEAAAREGSEGFSFVGEDPEKKR